MTQLEGYVDTQIEAPSTSHLDTGYVDTQIEAPSTSQLELWSKECVTSSAQTRTF